MSLKTYQQRVDKEVEKYLVALADEQAKGTGKHAASDAWERLRLSGQYHERRNALGEDLPTFCIKVPTGGGKTLLATQVLGSIARTIHRDRNGAGLVLWVVPSDQIYRDTLRRLKDRGDLYRIMLEHAIGRRIEIWEKHQIARMSPVRLADCLNILVFKLASANRQTKEDLKFFRDSGGNIVSHFPLETDVEAHVKLREEISNLEVIEGTDLLKTSVGNLVRLCRPAVIVDEGHKATSPLARETIEGFNASLVVELSATPKAWKDRAGNTHPPNIISRVTGQELLDEEMIKLPLNIATSGRKDWKDVLTQARDRRETLAKVADEHQGAGGARIRPMVLVQVERTGKDQREKGFVHSEQVREYLTQTLSVPDTAVKVKTAEDDGLEDIDLMDPDCPVQWVITKSALQEGWDCPFAYVLVSLNSTGSARAMTQLVGRILRQPYQKRTLRAELNESYVYCLHQTSGEIAKQVKKALEDEGYEGDLGGVVRDLTTGAAERATKVVRMRPEIASMYGREFDGKVYLPRFCVKDGGKYRPLDYFEHLLRGVDVEKFAYGKIDWNLVDDIKAAKDRFYKYQLGGDGLEREHEKDVDLTETDEQVLAWLVATLASQKFEFLSYKQVRRIVERVYERLCEIQLILKDRLGLIKFVVRDRIERFVQDELDAQTERVFDELFDAGRIEFYLKCAECRFEIPDSIKVERSGPLRPLTHTNGDPVKRSLFDFVEEEGQNQYERSVALVLDRDANVLWWFRNKVGKEFFTIQGPRRGRIFPDFVVQGEHEGRKFHRVFVVESKGAHLEGNPDTTYKRSVATYFDRAGKRVPWQTLGSEFKDHVFRFQILDEKQDYGRTWSDELRDLLAAPV